MTDISNMAAVAAPEARRRRKAERPKEILEAAFEEFARSIMTTDTRPKWATAKSRVGGKQPNQLSDIGRNLVDEIGHRRQLVHLRGPIEPLRRGLVRRHPGRPVAQLAD